MASQETSASPVTSPTIKKPNRKFSQRRARANSHVGHIDGHHEALSKIRSFLKSRSAFDVFPLSYRLIVFDTKLTVKHALNTMHQNGIVSAPIFNQKQWKFAGMLTLLDIIHLIQFYYLKAETFETAATDVETFRIESLRNIEKELNVPPPPLHSIHPSRPLYEACKLLIQSHARRLPLIDHDSASGMEIIASVLTQYRVLKFVASNCKEIRNLNYSLRTLGIGTYIDPKPDDPYHPIATATMDTTVFAVVHMFSKRGVSSVPVLDENGVVKNIYETLDVTTLVRSGTYTKLDLSIRAALMQRSADFQGVVTCTGNDSLGKLMELIGTQRVHRLVVVDDGGKLVGMITLSDILKYLVRDNMGFLSTPLLPAVESPAETEHAV